jgi:arylsulfatase A-like enzyme/superfamily II DNA or RNA helicase
MACFPADFEFRFTWRSYQARVLAELEEHLGDDHLHLVAAPGSGKTVLGLEVVRRLQQPTLVLAPTLTIRNQWVERLRGLFLPPGSPRPPWVSTDVREPRLLTVATYQALHVAREARRDDGGGAELTARLRQAGVRTLLVDEAHHLRSEWWKGLVAVKRALEESTIVALTATPPYDVPPHEWQRYCDLCGPVDAEIPVPELVQTGELCPHQDYVLFSTPTDDEARRLRSFRADVRESVAELRSDEAFARALEEHPWVAAPGVHEEEILSEPAYASSIAIFLNAVRDRAPDGLVRAMGLARRRVPKLNLEWLEVLLNGCLYRDRERLTAHAQVLEEVLRRFKRIGAVERRKVRLRATRKMARMLAMSASKVQSINTIVGAECAALGVQLRMVILTDYIRRSLLPRGPADLRPMTRMGVVPIFECLRRQGHAGVALGVLTGSLVIVPRGAVDLLTEAAARAGIESDSLRVSPLPHDETYVSVDVSGQDRQRIVRLITRAFSRGAVTVLIGTAALLGEGWDAPAVNTLVLASFVGSYMLSNQMRGRALRVEPGNPDKTANIWHLVCVQPKVGDPGDDLAALRRRFRAFVGLSTAEDAIQSGIRRLGIGPPPFRQADIASLNHRMLRQAGRRDKLRERWQRALGRPEEGRSLLETVRTPEPVVPRGFLLARTIKALALEAVCTGIAVWATILHVAGESAESVDVALVLAAVAFGFGALAMLPGLIKAGWLLLRYGPVAGNVRQIGIALARALSVCGLIESPPRELRVEVTPVEGGAVYCSLSGGTTYERSLFLACLQEITDPIENPRYLLASTSFLAGLRRRNYYPVPAELGRKKRDAQRLAHMWRRYVGPAELVYTRNTEGRRTLLRARVRSLAGALRGRSERLSCWKRGGPSRVARPPNLLFVMTDHQRADSLGMVQAAVEVTPALNRLAARSAAFTRAYNTCPLCAPARTALFTGKYPTANGVIYNDWAGETAGDHKPLQQCLHEAGYEVAHVGVHHVRVRPGLRERVPFALWVDESDHRRHLSEHGLEPMDRSAFRRRILELQGGELARVEYSSTRTAVWPHPAERFKDAYWCRRAAEFLRRRRERPFALFLFLWAPHPPLVVPEPYASMFDTDALELPANVGVPATGEPPGRRRAIAAQLAEGVTMDEWRRVWAAHLALVRLADDGIGRVLRALEDEALADETVVAFTVDHGEHLGQHAMYQKMEMYEQALRVPLLLHAPGAPAGQFATPVSHLDVMPTLLEVLGLESPGGMDGISLADSLREGREPPERAVFAQYSGNPTPGLMRRAVVTRRWKYVHDPDDEPELYDLEADLLETRNVAGEHACADVRARLHALGRGWAASHGDPAPF